MKTLNQAYQQNEADIKAVSEELLRLEQKRALLRELGAGPMLKVIPRKLGRAPKGSTQQAILEAITSTGQTNAEVRAKLKASGYAHSLNVLHVGKILNRLAGKKLIVKRTVGNRVEFTLP